MYIEFHNIGENFFGCYCWLKKIEEGDGGLTWLALSISSMVSKTTTLFKKMWFHKRPEHFQKILTHSESGITKKSILHQKKPNCVRIHIICSEAAKIHSVWKKKFTCVKIELDILFSSNHNIHKNSCGLCFPASDPLIERFQ